MLPPIYMMLTIQSPNSLIQSHMSPKLGEKWSKRCTVNIDSTHTAAANKMRMMAYLSARSMFPADLAG